MCSINSYFNKKVCTDYFWRLYVKNYKNHAILLLKASEKGYTEIVRILLYDKSIDRSRVNFGLKSNQSLRYASKNGHTEIVRMLLQHKQVNPTSMYSEALRYASEKGHIEIVKMLFEDSRSDPGAQNNYAIKTASLNGHVEVVRFLLKDKRVNPSDQRDASIRMASKNGHTEIVKIYSTIYLHYKLSYILTVNYMFNFSSTHWTQCRSVI